MKKIVYIILACFLGLLILNFNVKAAEEEPQETGRRTVEVGLNSEYSGSSSTFQTGAVISKITYNNDKRLCGWIDGQMSSRTFYFRVVYQAGADVSISETDTCIIPTRTRTYNSSSNFIVASRQNNVFLITGWHANFPVFNSLAEANNYIATGELTGVINGNDLISNDRIDSDTTFTGNSAKYTGNKVSVVPDCWNKYTIVFSSDVDTSCVINVDPRFTIEQGNGLLLGSIIGTLGQKSYSINYDRPYIMSNEIVVSQGSNTIDLSLYVNNYSTVVYNTGTIEIDNQIHYIKDLMTYDKFKNVVICKVAMISIIEVQNGTTTKTSTGFLVPLNLATSREVQIQNSKNNNTSTSFIDSFTGEQITGSIGGGSVGNPMDNPIEYIKSGFGLFGQNGLFAFLAANLTWIPNWVWVVVVTCFGCVTLAAVIRIIIDAI